MRRRRWLRWYSRPALLAGLALVLIVGGCLTIQSANSQIDNRTGQYGSGYAAQPQRGANGPALAGPVPQPPAPTTPTWTGTVRITDHGIDFSRQPPAVYQGDGYSTLTYSASGQTLATDGAGPVAVWTQSNDPTLEDCQQLVATQPLAFSEQQAIPYRQGEGLCVVTAPKIAMAFVRESGAPAQGGVLTQGVRWPLEQ